MLKRPTRDLSVVSAVATAEAYKMKDLRKYFEPSDPPSVCFPPCSASSALH